MAILVQCPSSLTATTRNGTVLLANARATRKLGASVPKRYTRSLTRASTCQVSLGWEWYLQTETFQLL